MALSRSGQPPNPSRIGIFDLLKRAVKSIAKHTTLRYLIKVPYSRLHASLLHLRLRPSTDKSCIAFTSRLVGASPPHISAPFFESRIGSRGRGIEFEAYLLSPLSDGVTQELFNLLG
jgi:hypothetical protein